MQMYNGMTNRQRAQVLVEALPYIQKYNGKIVVVKYGGNAMINEELKHDVMRDMVLMSLIGVKMVLVHGGGPEISSMLKRVGKETEFIDGLRVTDEETERNRPNGAGGQNQQIAGSEAGQPRRARDGHLRHGRRAHQGADD